jgi:hypothetical protein
MRDFMAYVLLCVFLHAFGVPAIAEVNGEAEEQIWICERWLEGELADSCELIVKKNGVLETTFTSKANDNQTIRLIAISFPLAKEAAYPKMQDGSIWYQGTNPSFGQILAKQLIEGEKWIFKIGDLEIPSEEPFEMGRWYSFEISAEIASSTVTSGELSLIGGSWVYFDFNDQPTVMIGAPGSYEIEINPEWAKHKWVQVPIPPEYGTFFGRAHAVGEVWTVTVGGKEYTAVVEEAEPNFDLSLLSCKAPLE